LTIYIVALRAGTPPDTARTLAIVALTAGNLMLVLLNASVGAGWRALLSNDFGAFWWVAGIASTALAAAIVLPAPRKLLSFGLPSWSAIALAIIGTAATIALVAAVLRMTAHRDAGAHASGRHALP
jgi:Ca2+-transporting ATPase